MKKTKRIISVIICIVLLLASLPMRVSAYARGGNDVEIGNFFNNPPTGNLYYGDVKNRLNDLMVYYLKPGRYWNHSADEPWGDHYFITTNTPCPNHSEQDGECSRCNHFHGASQCMGFAKLFCYGIFGTDPTGNCTVNNTNPNSDWVFVTDPRELCVGDYVRIYADGWGSVGHSFVITHIDGETVSYIQCNWDERCKISTDSTSLTYLDSIKSWTTNPSSSWMKNNYILHCRRNLSSPQASDNKVAVTFKVENGSWNDGTTADKTIYYYKGYTLGQISSDMGSSTNEIPSAGSKPSNGYSSGGWDRNLDSGMVVTENNTFTYNYRQEESVPISYSVTFKVINGSWNDGTTADKVVKLSGYEGDTLSLTLAQIPAVGNKPESTYKAGSWDVTPAAGSAITSNTIYTYTYKEASTVDAEEYWNTANTTDKLYWDDIKQRINDIMSYYLIPGKYWNHIGGVSGGGNVSWDNAYTTTDTSCSSHTHTMYGWDDEGEYCNWYDGASQCMGFAKLFSKGIFGTGIWSSDWTYGTTDTLCIGDYIRQNGHSYVVTHIDGDEVTILQCNAGGDCQITVGYRYLSQLKNVGFEMVDHEYDYNYIRHCNRNISNSATSMVVARNEVAELAYSQIGTEGGSKYYNSGDSGAWAVDFAKWCVRQCGMPTSWWPEERSTTKLVKWFQDQYRWHDKVTYNWSYKDTSGGGTSSYYIPRPGDMAAIETSNDADGPETVGIVYRVNITDDILDVVVGNVDNKVALRSFRLSDLHLCDDSNDAIHVIGFGEPEYGRTVREPVGAVELIEGGQGTIRVKGWAFDYDNLTNPLQIAVYIGGDEKSGAEYHIITANVSRTDINQSYGGEIGNNHGFDETITVTSRDNQEIFIYAIDIGNTILSSTNIGSIIAKSVQITEPISDVLTGTVKISGILKYAETLTAEVSDSNNTGTLSYQWKRGETAINGATGATYKLVKDDIGQLITCEVSSSVEIGSISATTSSTIMKANGPAAPTGMTTQKPSVAGASDGKILFKESNSYRYATKENFADAKIVKGTEITGLAAGTYYVKIAGTETHKESAATEVELEDGPTMLGGTVKISGVLKYGETLTAEVSECNNTGTLSYQWKRGDDAISGATGTTYKLVKADIGQVISCNVMSDVEVGSISATTVFTISKADGPAAPTGLTAAKPSRFGAKDGRISGTKATYEWADNVSFTNAAKCGRTEMTGLAAGNYYFRVAETATAKAGKVATVTVPEGPNALSGTVAISGSLKYNQTLTATVTNTNNTGTLSYQWMRGTEKISGATAGTYKTVQADIGKKLSCVVTSSEEVDSISGETSKVIDKADGPAVPEGISATAPSAKGKADGKVSGVTSAMEYAAIESFSNKKACTGTEITGLAAGTYYIRYAETATHKASAVTSVTVPEGKAAVDASAPKLNSATVSNGIVIFTWTANEGVTKYAVFRKVNSGSWAKIGEVNGTGYADSTVAEGHTYTYTARGINAAGKYVTSYDATGKSVTISVAVDSSAPVVLSATSGANGVTVTWKANNGVTKYAVFRKTDSGKWEKISEASGTNYVDSTATVGHTYSYTVRGVNAAGKYITSYDTVGKSVTLSTALDKRAPVITDVTNGMYGVIVTWKANNGVTKYAVFRKTDSGKWTKIGESSGTSYLDSAVTDGTYSYTVRGMDASGKYVTSYDTTGKSVTVGGNQQEALDALSPVLGSATVGANGITVTWTANSGVSKYAVFRKVVGGKWTKVGETTGSGDESVKTTAGTTCSYIDSTAEAGTTYTYTVRGLDANGKYITSYDMNGVSATMTSQQEEQLDKSSPVLKGATASANGITVTWTANSGVSKYAVFRKVVGGKWTKVGETTGSGDESVKATVGSTCSYVDSTTEAGKTYTYTVRGLNVSGKYITSYDLNGLSVTSE